MTLTGDSYTRSAHGQVTKLAASDTRMQCGMLRNFKTAMLPAQQAGMHAGRHLRHALSPL